MDTILRAIQDMSNAQRAHELNVFILEQVEEVRQGAVIGMISNDIVIGEVFKDDASKVAAMRVWHSKDQHKLDEMLNKKAYEMLLEQHLGVNYE